MDKNIAKITLPFDILPQIVGYRPHPDEEQTKQFPNCCKFHQNVYEVLTTRFENDIQIFTNRVKEELGLELIIAEYIGTPWKLITQLSYMEYFLAEKIDSPTWFRDFLHYLDYNEYSFGEPGPGNIWYLDLVKMYLLNVDDKIEKPKKELLIAELNYRIASRKGENKIRDYSNTELIRTTFRKWLKMLPLKGKNLKNLIEEDEWNSFAGWAETNQFDSRIITFIPTLKEDLINNLKYLTKQLLSEINNIERYPKLTKVEIGEYQLRLTLDNHEFRQKILLGEFTSDESSYIDILAKWLNNEEEFIGKYVEIVERYTIQPDTIPKGLRTLKAELTKAELEGLRLVLIENLFISEIANADFLYLFSAKRVIPSMIKLSWLKPNSWLHYLLKTIVFNGRTFNFKEVNSCIIGLNGKKLDSNSNKGGLTEIDVVIKQIRS